MKKFKYFPDAASAVHSINAMYEIIDDLQDTGKQIFVANFLNMLHEDLCDKKQECCVRCAEMKASKTEVEPEW